MRFFKYNIVNLSILHLDISMLHSTLQLPSYGYNFRKKRLAEFDTSQDLRENLIITKKYVLKMSVPTEIGAQMLSFL